RWYLPSSLRVHRARSQLRLPSWRVGWCASSPCWASYRLSPPRHVARAGEAARWVAQRSGRLRRDVDVVDANRPVDDGASEPEVARHVEAEALRLDGEHLERHRDLRAEHIRAVAVEDRAVTRPAGLRERAVPPVLELE